MLTHSNWRGVLVVIVALAVGAGTAAAWAAELGDSQRKLLGEAQSYMQRVETNLKLAQDAAGPGEDKPPASKSRLALVRLEAAKESLPQVEARLEKLTADHADVAAVEQRMEAATTAIQQLEDRLTGPSEAPSNTPSETPKQEAPPSSKADGAPAAVNLDYRQEQALKDARFYVREVEGKAAALAQLADQSAMVDSYGRINHRKLRAAMNTITDARAEAKNAGERLATLPANGQGVAETIAALKLATDKIDTSEKILVPHHADLTKQIDPASYPSLDADVRRLQALGSMYADTQVLQSDRERAAALLREVSAAQAEHQRIVTAYAPLIQRQTEAGKRVEGSGKRFVEHFNAFAAAAAQEKQSLPAAIEADLARVNQMADEAVAQQKPAYFTGGIPQHLAFAQEKLALYEVLDPQGASSLAAKLAQTRAQIKTREASLKDAIINANTLPPDQYRGEDRQALIDLATQAWRKQQPDAKVLAACIPSQNWKREMILRNQTGDWYGIDRSKLQVQLIVQADDKLAVIRPVNLWKDHLQNDQINALPMDAMNEVLPPQRYLLRSNVK